MLCSFKSSQFLSFSIHDSKLTGGRGAIVSACAGFTNQLQRCRFDTRIACLWNTDTAIVYATGGRGWGDTTPCTVNWCKKGPTWGTWLAFSYQWAFRISLLLIKFTLKKRLRKINTKTHLCIKLQKSGDANKQLDFRVPINR